ncbi:hypothetical protein [Treponema sp.]|uniref:hypothetical protein n=1 Tax=Treponema sp. TaxID=166 RepID=UPI00389073F5
MLGNLSIEEIESRLGFTFPDEIRAWMKSTRQENAQEIADDKWHCFDMPFMIVCGNKAFAKEITDKLQPFAKYFRQALRISYER